MSYAVKEMFLTPRARGAGGRRAVFVRFAGCNLWSGREQDRQRHLPLLRHRFRRVDGLGGGRFADAAALVAAVEGFWGTTRDQRFVVLTGASRCCRSTTRWSRRCMRRGSSSRSRAMGRSRRIRASTGCASAPGGITGRPALGAGIEAGLAPGGDRPGGGRRLDFANHLLQPLDDPRAEANREACIAMVMERPRWRLTLQTHKMLGLR
jgi:hypothetical protein